MASASDSDANDSPTFQPIHTVLKKTVEHLDEFPTHASVPSTRYSVPRLAAALLEYSPDPITLGDRLWDEFRIQRGSSGNAWRQLVAGFEQVDGDDDSKMVKIGTNDIKNMADVIRSSAQTQLVLYRWTGRYSHGLLQPMCRLSRSSAPFPGDPKFPRSLLARDGPSCLTTGTIHLGTEKKDVDEWTRNFAAGQAIHMDTLEASHIVPFPMASDKKAGTSRSYLADFSGDTIIEVQVTGDSINDPTNGLMMEKGAHSAFRSYRFGIECTDVPNSSVPEYRVRFVHDNLPKSLEGCDRRILHFGRWETTRFDKPSQTPLPRKDYLRTHLAIAKVLHASGAWEVFDQTLREEERLKEEEEEMERSHKRRRLLDFDDEQFDNSSSRSSSVISC